MNSWIFSLWLVVAAPWDYSEGVVTDEWGMQGSYQHLFNRETLQTLHGQILKIEPFSPGNRMCNGLHIVLRTQSQDLSVHLGPQWYLEDQQIVLHYGMQVSATGSLIQFNGQPAMIATEISTEHGVLQLRSDDGVPYWSNRLSSEPDNVAPHGRE